MKFHIGLRACLLAFFIAPVSSKPPKQDSPLQKDTFDKRPKISLVVDDLGDNSIIARQLLSITSPMTAAILPHTPHARQIAEFADQQGHQIIMHLPMEAFSRPDLLGPGALRANMEKSEIVSTLLSSAASIPGMSGFNNHMGSLLTEDKQKMRWVMESAQQQGWFFLDSKTSELSIAEATAADLGMATIARDIFLDPISTNSDINRKKLLLKQVNKAKTIARKQGQVVIICHPYPETLDFLRQQLPLLEKDFQLVVLTDLLTENLKNSSSAHSASTTATSVAASH